MRNHTNIIKLANYLLPLFVPAVTFAQATSATAPQQMGQILINVAQNFPAFLSWLNGLCVIIGVGFIMLAFFKLKHLADFKNMSAGQQDIGKAIMLIILGVVFLWMPFMLEVITYSVFGFTIGQLRDHYPISGANAEYKKAFFQMMYVLGIISFIRGWLILASMSKGPHQPGTMGKAVTHVVSGIFMINMLAFMNLLEKTMGTTFFKLN